MAREFTGGADKTGALLQTDSAVGCTKIIRLAGFHFDKYQAIFFPTDEIDFAGAGSHTVVTSDYDYSVALQVSVSDILAPSPQSMVGIERALPGMMPEHVGEFVQATHHLLTPNPPQLSDLGPITLCLGPEEP